MKTKSRRLSRKIFIIICILIWFIAILSVFFLPQNTNKILDYSKTENYQETAPVYSGDYVEQTFTVNYPYLENIQVAIKYDDVDSDGQISYQVLSGSSVICEQTLLIGACPNGGVLPLNTAYRCSQNEELVIRISNISTGNQSFRFLYTDNPYGMLTNIKELSANGLTLEGKQLITVFTYQSKSNWYIHLTETFLIGLFAFILCRLMYSRVILY